MNNPAGNLKAVPGGTEDTAIAAASAAMVSSDQVYTYLKQGAREEANIKAQSRPEVKLRYGIQLQR